MKYPPTRSSGLGIRLVILAGVYTLAGWSLASAEEVRSRVPTTTSIIYLKNPDRRLIVFFPDGWKASDKRSALVIFRCNIPHQREHFRKLGMVVIKAQLAPVNSGALPGLSLKEIATLPKPRAQVADTKSAMRYLRVHAGQLGIDPSRIVATGTSGGGDLALLSHLNRTFENPGQNSDIPHSPDGLVLYCPAFDGIDIWFVQTSVLLARTRKEAPAFVPFLGRFVKRTDVEYAQPLDHRATLIDLAVRVGKEEGIASSQVEAFQSILGLFNKRDWQLLHPIEDALQMAASRLLTRAPLPPTIILFGERDHLYKHQVAFVETARRLGQEFDLKIYKNGAGHSFMTQPAFLEPSTREVENFLRKSGFLPRD